MTFSTHKIYSRASEQLWQIWIFTAVWNVVIWLIMFKEGDRIIEAFDANPVFYFFVIFPFVGMMLIYQAVKKTLEKRKYGRTPVVLNPFPGQVGGRCSGYLDLPLAKDSAGQATVTLTCIHHRASTDSRGRRHMHEKALWQDKVAVKLHYYGRFSRLEFAFNPPEHMPGSEDESDDYHSWQLHVQIAVKGVDYDRVFELPMKKIDDQTRAANARYQFKAEKVERFQETQDAPAPEISTTDGGLRFYYGYARNKGLGLALLGFGIGLMLMGYFFFQPFKEFLPLTSLLMSATVMLIALLLSGFGLFLLANNMTVEVSPAGIIKQQRIFGVLLREQIRIDELADINLKQTASSSSGHQINVWYSLQAVTKDGRRVCIGDTLASESFAGEIHQKIIDTLGNWRPAPVPVDSLESPTKKQLPVWARVMLKLLSYSYIVAFLLDIYQAFPQLKAFIS